MARKNRSLPFVVKPKLAPIVETIGNEFSGTIEVERRGYLSVAEKAWTQVFDQEDDSQSTLFSLAVKIGNDLSIDPTEVFRLITDTNANDPRLEPYSGELLMAIQGVNAAQERRKFAMATCLIASRIDQKWEIEDTMSLHPDIVEGLAVLFEQEEAKSIDALVAANSKDNEDVPTDPAPKLGKD